MLNEVRLGQIHHAGTEGVINALYAYEADVGVLCEVPQNAEFNVQILGTSEIVASGAGIWFVSAAEYGHDDRFRMIQLDGPAIEMGEALNCLRERIRGNLVAAFL